MTTEALGMTSESLSNLAWAATTGRQMIERIWYGPYDNRGGYLAVDKAFETLPNLRELSFVHGHDGRTWYTVCGEKEAQGANSKALKTRDFDNPKHICFVPKANIFMRRWF